MNRILVILTVVLALIAAGCNRAASDASEACKAAEKGDVTHALEYADKAYENFDQLNVDALCRLAASYAVITLTTGDQQSADRFQKCYKASMNANPKEAEKVYGQLDPQMADGLAIISGLLDGRDNFTTAPRDNADSATIATDESTVAEEALSMD